MLQRAPLVFTALALFPLLLASCGLFGGEGCDTQEVPSAPVLLTVTQDPVTLQVTATVEDTSEVEQWVTLERSLVSRFTRSVVVGTSVDSPDREDLPLDRSAGDTFTIEDRGIVEGELLEPGERYSYHVRAWNCHGWSPDSNDIVFTALGEN